MLESIARDNFTVLHNGGIQWLQSYKAGYIEHFSIPLIPISLMHHTLYIITEKDNLVNPHSKEDCYLVILFVRLPEYFATGYACHQQLGIFYSSYKACNVRNSLSLAV